MTSVPPAAPGGAPAAKSPVLSILSLVGGIIGLLLACCFGAGFLFAVAGVVLGVLGRKREPNGKGLALGGLITGIAGAVISLLMWVLLLVAPAALSFLPYSTYGYYGY